MKNILKNFDFSIKNILKIIGIGILSLLFLIIAIWFLSFAFRTAFFGGVTGSYKDDYYNQSVDRIKPLRLSERNVLVGNDFNKVEVGSEKEFEITEYFSVIKTRKFDKVCSEIEKLKSLDYIIFENSNKNDRSCKYTFKVKNKKAEEVLVIIKSFKPESLQTNKFTLKNVIDDYESEIDILTKKLDSVEVTLSEAQVAYDKVTYLATKNQDVESLAKIIDSKISLIERLTKERIETKEKIDRLNRSKAEQIERTEYTMFDVSVYDVVILDMKQIKDSWVYELKRFVREFNSVIQSITVGLATYLLKLIQIVIYLLIALFVIKYGWRFTKFIWKK